MCRVVASRCVCPRRSVVHVSTLNQRSSPTLLDDWPVSLDLFYLELKQHFKTNLLANLNYLITKVGLVLKYGNAMSVNAVISSMDSTYPVRPPVFQSCRLLFLRWRRPPARVRNFHAGWTIRRHWQRVEAGRRLHLSWRHCTTEAAAPRGE